MAGYRDRYNDDYPEMSMGRPYSIADAVFNRRQTEQAQHDMWANNEMARSERINAALNLRAKHDEEVYQAQRMNRLGLSPLASQLNDTGSAAYQDVDAETGQPYQAAPPQISVGGLDGSAPPESFGLAPFRKLRREIKPEHRPALEAQRTEDAVNTRPVSPYENPLRQEESRTKKLDTLYGIYGNMSNSEKSSPNGQAIMDEIQATLRGDNAAPATDTTAPAAAPTTAPTATTGTPRSRSGGVDVMEVVEEEDETGKVVRGEGGKRYFIPAGTDQRIEVK